jgi:hypothetical protein
MLKIKTKGSGMHGRRPWKKVPAALLSAAAVFASVSCMGVDGNHPESGQAQTATAARGSAITTPTDISTLAQLRTMSLTGNYRLIKDITMTSSDAGFTPIGGPFDYFSGTFDGNGFRIINFRTVNYAGNQGYYRGLFGIANGAILRRVRLTNVNVAGEAHTGAIVGSMMNTLLTDSYVDGGTVSGPTSTFSSGYGLGMAVGVASNSSEIRKCYATGSIKGVALSMGGFVGEANGYGTTGTEPRVTITEVYTKVDVNATPPDPSYNSSNIPTGGVVGLAQGVVMKNIYAAGPVKGRGWPGGIVGRIVNNDPSYLPSEFHKGVYIGDVASTSGPARAGAIGSLSGNFVGRCAVFYNKSVDGGTAIQTYDTWCNGGMTTSELQSPHPDPDKLLWPYTIGMVITQQMINESNGDIPQCKLASGTDADWYFGICPGDPLVWKANASNQYNTLANIPNPGVQTLQ